MMSCRRIHMHRVSCLTVACLLLLALAGCRSVYKEDGMTGATESESSKSSQEKAEARPRVLIIGDSISMGYTPFVQTILADDAEVLHNPGNAESTRRGVARIDEWLGEIPWDVIVFNHGLHDLKFVDDNFINTSDPEKGRRQVSVEDYEANLERIVARLRETSATLLFATTTPYPDLPEGPVRYAADVDLYNAAALRVMRRHDIAVIDLHGVVHKRLDEFQQPNNVHFTREGSMFLAEHVAADVRRALGERR